MLPTNCSFTNHIKDLALNNLQGLICNTTNRPLLHSPFVRLIYIICVYIIWLQALHYYRSAPIPTSVHFLLYFAFSPVGRLVSVTLSVFLCCHPWSCSFLRNENTTTYYLYLLVTFNHYLLGLKRKVYDKNNNDPSN